MLPLKLWFYKSWMIATVVASSSGYLYFAHVQVEHINHSSHGKVTPGMTPQIYWFRYHRRISPV